MSRAGRRPDELRPVELVTDYVEQAHGSVLISFGRTRVLCTASIEEAIKRVAATMACHAAVKANDPLTAEKMAHILEELRRTAYSTICPHGRPVMLRLTRREVEKNLQRI